MSEFISTGTLERDVDAIDGLDDDPFRGLVEQRVADVSGNKAIWTVLYQPTLIDRAEGCLEEIAEELHDEIVGKGLPATHHKAKRLRLVNHRLHQLRIVSKAATERAAGVISNKERERQAIRAIVVRLTLAIDVHRQECIRLELTPEPHDLALWDVLDALSLPAGGDGTGPTLAEQITAGRWQHQAVERG